MTSQKDLMLSWNTVVFAIEHLLPKLLYIESTEVLTVFVSMEELDMKLNRLDPGLLLHILFLELDIVCNLMWEMTANIFLLRWLVGSERWLLITRGCLSIFYGYLATDSGIAVETYLCYGVWVPSMSSSIIIIRPSKHQYLTTRIHLNNVGERLGGKNK